MSYYLVLLSLSYKTYAHVSGIIESMDVSACWFQTPRASRMETDAGQ